MSAENNGEWTQVIEPTTSAFRFNFSELWRYRDLVMLFVRRDFISAYKQTLLGPFWHFMAPIFTTVVYVAFGAIASIPTDGLPRVLFCITGVVAWNFFAGCLTKTSNTFVANSTIFGKVYFPRLTIPISTVISNLLSLGIQFLTVIPFLIYFRAVIHPNVFILFIPIVIVLLGVMGLGIGIIVSALTTRYRDLSYLVGFAITLAVYATPIIYPLSMLKGKLRLLASFNPVTPLVEVFRYAMLGKGTFTIESLLYSALFAFFILFIGIIAFNQSERTFVDTV